VLGGDRSCCPPLDPPLSGFTIISKLLSECWLVGLLQLSYDPWHKPLVAPLGIINFYPSLNMALKSLFCNKKLFSYYIMHPGMRHDRKTCLWHSPYEPTCACNVDKMLNSSWGNARLNQRQVRYKYIVFLSLRRAGGQAPQRREETKRIYLVYGTEIKQDLAAASNDRQRASRVLVEVI